MKRQNFVEKVISKLYSMLVVLFLFTIAPFFDCIYIQKVALSKIAITVLRNLNSNIVFDFDDAIYLYQDITHLLEKARSIVVSNKYLKEFACKYNKRIYELISPVEINNRSSFKKSDFITLGWIGSPAASKYLYPLLSVFKTLKANFKNLNIEFMGVERNKYFEPLGIKIMQWSIEKEKDYLQRIDIGIMPLTDDAWSRGKGGYKILQYMAVGIPCVASPVGINKEILKDGINGFLAHTPQEWIDKLSLLIADTSLRQKLGQEGQRLAERLYSYRANTSRLMEILKNASLIVKATLTPAC